MAVNQYFPPSHAGLFRWQGFKNGQALARCAGAADGSNPQHFFQSAAIRNRFPAISPEALLTETTAMAIKSCNNGDVVACDCVCLPFTSSIIKRQILSSLDRLASTIIFGEEKKGPMCTMLWHLMVRECTAISDNPCFPTCHFISCFI